MILHIWRNIYLFIASFFQVKIESKLDGRAKRILLEGRTIDVVTTKSEIQKYFTDIQLEKSRKLEDRLMNKEIQWRFKDSGGQWVDYGDDLNPLIERALQEKKSHRILDLEDGKIRIHFGTMKEQDVNGVTADVDVERVDLKKGDYFFKGQNGKNMVKLFFIDMFCGLF